VRLAARGTRNMDAGEERIEDATAVARLRTRARTVTVQSSLAAAVLTALSLVP
jgi:hypothetical protein